MLTLDKIYHASYVLKDVIRQTNIVQARGICDDCDVYLKPENLQITGSFKVRGSGYKISQLTEEEKARGVIACSAGNHAQGVALAATKYGIKSLICLPDGAPISKVEATKNYGAEVCMVPGVYDDAYNEALRLRDEKNYTFIHPFDDENVIELSVILQVSYFKITHGKRLFKMSPIHHHFEMCGWSEVKIVGVFSAVTAVFGAIAFALAYFGA